MGTHMKTTIEIADALLKDARRIAAREGTTVRALVEQGLRQRISQSRRGELPFKLRKASVGGNGLTPEASAAGWERLRSLSYENRGG
jgi:hypothetical protein